MALKAAHTKGACSARQQRINCPAHLALQPSPPDKHPPAPAPAPPTHLVPGPPGAGTFHRKIQSSPTSHHHQHTPPHTQGTALCFGSNNTAPAKLRVRQTYMPCAFMSIATSSSAAMLPPPLPCARRSTAQRVKPFLCCQGAAVGAWRRRFTAGANFAASPATPCLQPPDVPHTYTLTRTRAHTRRRPSS